MDGCPEKIFFFDRKLFCITFYIKNIGIKRKNEMLFERCIEHILYSVLYFILVFFVLYCNL